MKNLLEYEEFLFERNKRSPEEVNKSAEANLKRQMDNYIGLAKNYPKKAPIYKARIDLVRAKLAVVAAKKKVQSMTK